MSLTNIIIFSVKKTARRYQHFNSYCLRNPLFPFSFYEQLTKNNNIDFKQLKFIWKNKTMQEALFLASPFLYTEIDKMLKKNKIEHTPKAKKIQLAFLKYLSRMSSRCTPFGLFAGCSVGVLSEKTNITLVDYLKFNRQTRFDMNFLVALALQLTNKPTIKKQLLFYPNTSLYKAGNHLRYIEYKYKDNRRIHNLEAVSNTDYLDKIVHLAKTGKKLSELADSLVSEEITKKEATHFIDSLVENQLLVSTLEPTVSGGDFLQQIIVTLAQLKGVKKLVDKLQNLALQLSEIDTKLGNSVTKYYKIKDVIKELETEFELKYLFQTDLFSQTNANTLNYNILKKAKEGLILLNKISVLNKKTNLNSFKIAFVKRYEQEEIPLTLALDIEMGIGYLQYGILADDTPILDDLTLPQGESEQSLSWNKTQNLLHKKLLENNNKYILELKEEDFKDFEEDWTNLSDTISTLAEVLVIDGIETVFMNSVSGSSAANLLGRFADGNESIHQLVKEIVEKEQQLQPNKILAEIVHLPQARTGNILKRPQFREYEIPYLAKSTVKPKHQLDINDLMVSVQNDTIVLRSKKYNKEVIPHLTNAHNYSNGLPIYHFLCDLQTQNKRSLYFSWGNAAMNQSFLPRVVYKDVIFSKANWIINKEDLIPFKKITDNIVLLQKINRWRKDLKMPKYVQFLESDNTLLINLTNSTSIKMFLQSIKNRTKIILEEFLFAKDGMVKSKEGYYTNQVVLSFYKV